MTSRIILLQHGEKIRVAGDPGLTLRGRRQAEAASRAITAMDPVAIISSPSTRARETASPLATRIGSSIRIDDRLRERLNLEEGQPVEEFIRDWARSTEDRSWSSSGGRSSITTAEDMLSAVEAHAQEDLAVVLAVHGGATVDLLRSLLGDDPLRAAVPGLIEDGVPGGAITVLEPRSGRWLPTTIASVQHIPPQDRTGHAPAR